MTDKEKEIEAKLKELGIAVVKVSGPNPGVDGDWPHIAYVMQVMFSDGFNPGVLVIETPYKMGVGCVDLHGNLPLIDHWEDTYVAALKQMQQRRPVISKLTEAEVACRLAVHQGVVPSAADVVASLVADGSPFFNAQSFEEWADECGYHPDSRKAERTYNECMETGRKLKRRIPAEVLDKVRDLVADY